MKKTLRILTLALACCMICTAAFAGDVNLFDRNVYADESAAYTGDDSVTYNMMDAACVGDTIYMVVSVNTTDAVNGEYVPTYYQMWQWKDGMTSPVCMADRIFYMNFYDANQTLADVAAPYAPDADIDHPLWRIYTDGEKLFSINVVSGTIFLIDVEEGKLTFTDMVTVDNPDIFLHKSPDYIQTKSIWNMAVVGDTLAILFNDYDDDTYETIFDVYMIDLKTGKTKISALQHCNGLSPYKDGKLLVLTRDVDWDNVKQKMNDYDMQVLDISTDTATKIGTFPAEADTNGGWAYSVNLDSVIYYKDNKIIAYKNEKDSKQVGYLPINSTRKIYINGDDAVFVTYDGVYRRTLDTNFRTDEYLNIYNSYMGAGAKKFFKENPQVPVYMSSDYYSSVEQIGNAMVSGDSSVDVLQMFSSDGLFSTMKNKGYCLDLSGSTIISDYVNKLYPQFRDYVTVDGKILAVPLQGYSYDGWFVNKNVMTEMGLTIDDIPKNLVDLCAFATRWNNEWTEKYPNYSLLEYTSDHKATIMQYMVQGYLNHCTATGETIDLNSPCFREMMEAVDRMQVKNLDKRANSSEEDEIGYREALLMPSYTGVGNFDMVKTNNYNQYVDMNLCKDIPHEEAVTLTVMFVNPRTKHPQLAVRYLECMVETLDDRNKCVLDSTASDPVLNEYYDKNIAREKQYIEQLRKTVEECTDPEEKKMYEEQLKSEEEYFEIFKEENKYTISAEGIDFYRNTFTPHMIIKVPTFAASANGDGSNELVTLEQRYLQGQISMEQFISEAGNKVRMMQAEMQ